MKQTADTQHDGEATRGGQVRTHAPGANRPPAVTSDEEMRRTLMGFMDVRRVCKQVLETPEKVTLMMRAMLLEKQGTRAAEVMRQVHEKIHRDKIPTGVEDNCFRCGIDRFVTPVAPTATTPV